MELSRVLVDRDHRKNLFWLNDDEWGRMRRGDLLQLAQEVRRLGAIRDEAIAPARGENGKLKKIVADLTLDKAMLQDVIRRKL
jgi:hypothetical protein